MAYHFGDLRLTDENDVLRLFKGEQVVKIGEKPLRVLKVLIEHKGGPVTEEVILKNVWRDTLHGSETRVANAVRQLREVIGAASIVTHPKQGGYEFVGADSEVPASAGMIVDRPADVPVSVSVLSGQPRLRILIRMPLLMMLTAAAAAAVLVWLLFRRAPEVVRVFLDGREISPKLCPVEKPCPVACRGVLAIQIHSRGYASVYLKDKGFMYLQEGRMAIEGADSGRVPLSPGERCIADSPLFDLIIVTRRSALPISDASHRWGDKDLKIGGVRRWGPVYLDYRPAAAGRR